MRLSKFTALAELDARDQDIADADLKGLGFLVPTLETISGCQRGYEYKLVVTSWLAGRPKSWRKLPSRYASSAPLPSRPHKQLTLIHAQRPIALHLTSAGRSSLWLPS